MHGAITLIYQSFVPKSFEHPPDAFHVLLIHGLIRMLHIRPASDAWHYLFPLRRILHHGRATEIIKLCHAEGFDIFFMLDTERLFRNILDR